MQHIAAHQKNDAPFLRAYLANVEAGGAFDTGELHQFLNHTVPPAPVGAAMREFCEGLTKLVIANAESAMGELMAGSGENKPNHVVLHHYYPKIAGHHDLWQPTFCMAHPPITIAARVAEIVNVFKHIPSALAVYAFSANMQVSTLQCVMCWKRFTQGFTIGGISSITNAYGWFNLGPGNGLWSQYQQVYGATLSDNFLPILGLCGNCKGQCPECKEFAGLAPTPALMQQLKQAGACFKCSGPPLAQVMPRRLTGPEARDWVRRTGGGKFCAK